MTPLVFKAVRERCDLTQVQLASWLGFSRNGDRHIRAIEAGERQPSGPVVVLMHILDGVYAALRDPKSEHHKSAVSLAKRGWLPFDLNKIGGNNG